MPLVLAALTQGLPGAVEAYPWSRDEAAAQWAQAMGAYAAGVMPPSTSVVSAAGALALELAVSFASPSAIDLIEQAFANFAQAVGEGMLGYVVVPPPGLVGFLELAQQTPPLTRVDGVARVAARIDDWMRTGTAAPVASPQAVVPWQ